MKASQLRDKSDSELIEQERELREELFNLRFQHATGQLENTMAIVRVKKDIARVKTILREKTSQRERKREASDVPADS
ncbi:MAG: 50S ribosomal protein L29 [Syntrophobacterales bacterium]|nr:MAG: 50S ribosomal protein L29 [Syntrophobacterales bacterium]